MRRRRSFRRGSSSRKSRKTYWNGFVFAGHDVVLRPTFGHGDVATAWAKWPSGTPDFSDGEIDNEGAQTPSDETLVRTLLQCAVNLPEALPTPLICTAVVGLITWDRRLPAELENVVTNNVVPNPAEEWSADWIIRAPFAFVEPNLPLFSLTDLFQVSRAMRKLPPLTGILACVAIGNPLGAIEDEVTINWCVDGRFALKSGYYQVGP